MARARRRIVDHILDGLSPLFEQMYSDRGRPSIPPEQLLKATLLMAFYSIRSERQFCERLQYDLLFKWFLGLNITDPAFDPTSFSHNRERLLQHEVAVAFLGEVVREAQRRRLVSEDHFSVDGTLLQAWASLKSYRPRDEQGPPTGGGRNPSVDFHGERRSRETHVSRTDPEALLFKKAASEAARLSYVGHALIENRNGLVMDILVSPATGDAERTSALRLVGRMDRKPGITLAADKGYDTYAVHRELLAPEVVPHLAWNDGIKRRPMPEALATDTRHRLSQRRRKLVVEFFGWTKTWAAGGSCAISAWLGTSSGRPSPLPPTTSSALPTWSSARPEGARRTMATLPGPAKAGKTTSWLPAPAVPIPAPTRHLR